MSSGTVEDVTVEMEALRDIVRKATRLLADCGQDSLITDEEGDCTRNMLCQYPAVG